MHAHTHQICTHTCLEERRAVAIDRSLSQTFDLPPSWLAVDIVVPRLSSAEIFAQTYSTVARSLTETRIQLPNEHASSCKSEYTKHIPL
ncbi:unnamed protein product [Protopolystoma xenopodis]|uniref:Uncharacterized protein n=1 Tax=Protopolystoma xenopodis TaxID=117903 RepID=A0A3S5AA26_9PLAT|nr:unnamed protein product [Protopolystoma xenopodis]